MPERVAGGSWSVAIRSRGNGGVVRGGGGVGNRARRGAEFLFGGPNSHPVSVAKKMAGLGPSFPTPRASELIGSGPIPKISIE